MTHAPFPPADPPPIANTATWPLRDISLMDSSVVERLRATVEMSVGWANETLDVLIRLDDNLVEIGESVRQRIQSLRLQDEGSNKMIDDITESLEAIAGHSEKCVQRARMDVREVMTSMQYQDVIGQSVERAAAALENRDLAIRSIAEQPDFCQHCTEAIAKTHEAYRLEDDLHRPVQPDKEDYAGIRAA